MRPPLLLVPGPVPLHPRVQEEMAKPALPHYGDAWVRAYTKAMDLLRYTWEAPHARVFPVVGPGHAGLESLAHTFLRRGDRVVVVDNGFFGDRTREVLAAHRLQVDVVRSEWGGGPDLEGLRAALRQPARAVAVVHNETSTGVTNPLREVVEAAHARGAFVLVDAVSSFAGLPLSFERLGVDGAFSASQKCLAAPAGIAPVCIADSLWESVDPEGVEGWYFNLFTWDRYARDWGKWHPTPTTVSTNLFYAFLRALELVKEEGLQDRVARHARVAARMRGGLAELDFRTLAPPELVSNTVACVRLPSGADAATVQQRLRDEHGIYVSGGLGPLHGKVLRIGTMGTQAEPEVADAFLKALRASL